MTKEKEKKTIKSDTEEKDIERILEHTWNNWTSRRRCESTHVPEIFKKEKKK
ncbi:MAG: hypothetical protein ACFFAS_15310 [Promethearchaeota archaeon]